MKLFLVLIILLFEVPTDGIRPKKCFNNITGYCRKKCKMGEIYESSCRNGKLCCVDEADNKKSKEVLHPPQLAENSNVSLDYMILPTITVSTIQL
ncbi:beta-defensin 128 [Loxodonta africana]|uniref:Beta-defensin n=1 Tax=Loxodonta africana TaxID=9785 RepID=G3TJ85_LOXAF|nr:beta-defensin 128 [Loxodonta africana]XP_049725100.1 beta-defensin 128 [Elephas maximus indicus]